MTYLIIATIGLLFGMALRELFDRARATPRATGHHPRQPTSKPKGPAPPTPPVGRRAAGEETDFFGRPLLRGPHYNPPPDPSMKPPPPPAPPNRIVRYGLFGVHEVKPGKRPTP